jgi:prepilin-type N-terminal cleavage/methylation domain-containing protein
MRTTKGYTLFELMIVVLIIAILGAIAISQYQDNVIRAQIGEAAALAAGVKTAVAEYHNSYGRFPAAPCAGANNAVGIASPASINGAFVSEVRVAGDGCASSLGAGSIVTVFSSDSPQQANQMIDTASLIFSPTTHAGSISWRCKRFLIGGSVELRDKWLPSSCR